MKAGKIHKLAASLYKPRGSKCGNKVAVYSPEITVVTVLMSDCCFLVFKTVALVQLSFITHAHTEWLGVVNWQGVASG